MLIAKAVRMQPLPEGYEARAVTDVFPPGDYCLRPCVLSQADLADLLRAAPSEPLLGDGYPRYLWRGQPQQYVRDFPPEPWPAMGMPANTYQMDSLLPADFRQMDGIIRAGRREDPVARLVLGRGVPFTRALLVAFALERLWVPRTGLSRGHLSSWLDGGHSRRFDKSMSLGQHCGLPTHLLDATSDPWVAVWFAARCRTQEDTGQSPGVIYRFDREVMHHCEWAAEASDKASGLRASCASAHADSTTRTPASRYRHVCVSDAPGRLTPRPGLQKGWSLVGWQSPWLLLDLQRQGGVQVHALPTSTDAGTSGRLDAMDLLPDPDPVFAAIEQLLSDEPAIREFESYRSDCAQRCRDQLDFEVDELPDIRREDVRRAVLHGWRE